MNSEPPSPMRSLRDLKLNGGTQQRPARAAIPQAHQRLVFEPAMRSSSPTVASACLRRGRRDVDQVEARSSTPTIQITVNATPEQASGRMTLDEVNLHRCEAAHHMYSATRDLHEELLHRARAEMSSKISEGAIARPPKRNAKGAARVSVEEAASPVG